MAWCLKGDDEGNDQQPLEVGLMKAVTVVVTIQRYRARAVVFSGRGESPERVTSREIV